ncbi:unnamed protein product, partial [marine sediment metagenome]
GVNLKGLGVVATSAAAGTAAASPFIIFLKKIMGSINPSKLFKGVKKLVKRKNPDGSTSVEPANENFTTTDFDESGLPDNEFDESSEDGMMDKVKTFYDENKKKIMIGGIGLVIVIVAIIGFKKYSKKKKNQLRGLKAAQTRKRNARKKTQLKGAPKRKYNRKKTTPKKRKYTPRKKQLGRGSTTIIKHPTKGRGKARMSIRDSGQRFSMMHAKAKQLQKKHPNTKYSTLLSRASKLI